MHVAAVHADVVFWGEHILLEVTNTITYVTYNTIRLLTVTIQNSYLDYLQY